MTPAAAVAALRRGRLTPQRRTQIFAATLSVLTDTGFDRMTMDAVAAEAGASKATLYRHWPGKAELVIDAVRNRVDEEWDLPDTGSLREDLLTFLRHALDPDIGRRVCLMRELVAVCGRDANLARAFRERLVQSKRRAALQLLTRAQRRGQIPSTVDIRLVVDIAPAMVMFRHLFTPDDVDEAFVTRVVDEVWLPALTGQSA